MIAACPSCDTPLVAFIHGGVELDVCSQCGGIWLDEGEFADLSDAAAQPHLPTDALLAELSVPGHKVPGKARLCPRCVKELEEITLPALGHCPATHLDRCPHCHGLFFDANELAAVLRRHHSPDSPLSLLLAEFFGPDFLTTNPTAEGPQP